jgi:hypothetical protein
MCRLGSEAVNMRKLFSALPAILGGLLVLMMEVGPHDAAANFCNWLSIFLPTCFQFLPRRFDSWAWALPALLIFLSLVLLILPAVAKLFLKLRQHKRGLIDLKEAAAQIYGELRGTDLGRFTEGHTGSSDEILDNIGMQILHNADVQVRRPPSPKWEPFPKSELNKMTVCDGASGIRYFGKERAVFTDLKVTRKNVARVLKHLKANAKWKSDWSREPFEQPKEHNDIAESYGNLRIADYPEVIALFDNTERDKLLPLLEEEKLSSWGRPMGSGEPPLTKLSGQLWKTHHLMFLPKEGQQTISQTFLKTKARNETSYYDIHLNRAQIERVWPKIELISLFEAASRTYEQTRNRQFSILAELDDNSANGILIRYCNEMTRYQNGKEPLVKLYGNRPPSRKKEEIYIAPLSRYEFVVEGNAIILQEAIGGARYENLSVSAKEVDAAIRELSSRKV